MLDNLFVCELNEQVIGLILWVEGALNWSASELRKEMQRQGLSVPTNLDRVEREYVSGYSGGETSDEIAIVNLCVEKQSRNRRIGKRMLDVFLEKHPEKCIELCVLSSNNDAINLYTSCGFRQCGEEEQAYPSDKKDHKRRTMRRP